MAITKLLLNGIEYDIGNIYNIVTEGPQLYEGRELSEYTWADLSAKCKNADYSDLRIGDYKTIVLTTGEVVKMQIAGIDTYYKATTIEIPHHIDWISINSLNQEVKWNTVLFNNGNASESCPWLISNAYMYLQNNVYPTLPSDVKAIIKNKRTIVEERYSNEGELNNDSGTRWEFVGNLWLPTEYEVNGSITLGDIQCGRGVTVQYPLFANSILHKIKWQGNTNLRTRWWLSSVNGYSKNGVLIIDYTGGIFSLYSNDERVYLLVCFRIT